MAVMSGSHQLSVSALTVVVVVLVDAKLPPFSSRFAPSTLSR